MNTEKKRSGLVALGIIAVGLLGCAATMESGGFTVNKPDAEQSFASVRKSASAEASCPSEQLDLVVLDVDSNVSPNIASKILATGCGKKLVYVATQSGWILNSATQ